MHARWMGMRSRGRTTRGRADVAERFAGHVRLPLAGFRLAGGR